MWNKYFKILLFLPLILFWVSVAILIFYIGLEMLWLNVIIEALFLLGIGASFAFNKKKLKWLGFILMAAYIAWGVFLGRYDFPKWGTTYFHSYISIYFILIFGIKSIPKYNKENKVTDK